MSITEWRTRVPTAGGGDARGEMSISCWHARCCCVQLQTTQTIHTILTQTTRSYLMNLHYYYYIPWKVSSGWHENCINYSNTTKNSILFIDVSASCQKPSSGLTSGGLSRIRQCWQTHKGGDMDQEDWQHESRRGELPVESRMGQAFTYWRPSPEVNPDERFRHEAEMSINSMLFLVVLE